MKNGFNTKLKNEGALKKRFLRHDGIYRSDVSSLLVNLGQSPAIRSGPGQAIGRAGKYTPCPSSAMSSGRLFLDRVGRHQSPSPLHRHHQNKPMAFRRPNDYHRTAGRLLTVCVSRGDKRTDTRVCSADTLVGAEFHTCRRLLASWFVGHA